MHTLLKINLQLFAEKGPSFEKWLKEEIQSLDQLDIDKAQMKDASNKAVTPTSLYKKYIGDNPGQDYAEVTEYEKEPRNISQDMQNGLNNRLRKSAFRIRLNRNT